MKKQLFAAVVATAGFMSPAVADVTAIDTAYNSATDQHRFWFVEDGTDVLVHTGNGGQNFGDTLEAALNRFAVTGIEISSVADALGTVIDSNVNVRGNGEYTITLSNGRTETFNINIAPQTFASPDHKLNRAAGYSDAVTHELGANEVLASIAPAGANGAGFYVFQELFNGNYIVVELAYGTALDNIAYAALPWTEANIRDAALPFLGTINPASFNEADIRAAIEGGHITRESIVLSEASSLEFNGLAPETNFNDRGIDITVSELTDGHYYLEEGGTGLYYLDAGGTWRYAIEAATRLGVAGVNHVKAGSIPFLGEDATTAGIAAAVNAERANGRSPDFEATYTGDYIPDDLVTIATDVYPSIPSGQYATVFEDGSLVSYTYDGTTWNLDATARTDVANRIPETFIVTIPATAESLSDHLTSIAEERVRRAAITRDTITYGRVSATTTYTFSEGVDLSDADISAINAVIDESFRTGYEDGYKDGYTDGYVYGFELGVASVDNS